MAKDLRPGDIIQDTYRIDGRLGQGGMGTTWRGTNLTTGDVVAIKVMSAEIALVPKAVDLFRREAQLLRKVQSEAVIRYETTLQDRDGGLYLIMEYIDGQPLAHYLERGARLAPADVLRLGLRIAGGLASIHALGIVHRDVAPDNIMVPDGDVQQCKLIDFGLASSTIGTEASIIGTSYASKYSFSSPEQLGLHGARVGPASDVYSLGLVLMKMAGLQVPGEGMGIGAVDVRRRDVTIPPASGLPESLRAILESMLRTLPDDRPKDFVKALTAAGARIERKARIPMRKFAALGIGVVVAAAAAAGGGYLILQQTSKDSGKSVVAVKAAGQVLAADDPFFAIEERIIEGDLEAAFASLMALAHDSARAAQTRQRAYLGLAKMYDPATFDRARSPFPQPNPTAARRAYQAAADLGSEQARSALANMGE